MSVVTDKKKVIQITENTLNKNTSLAIFGVGSHWNVEAVLIAAENFARKYNIKDIPVVISMTYTYRYMPQALRINRKGDPIAGFKSIMEYIMLLCGREDSPYKNVVVLPHLDHANPEKDVWALTEGTKYLASVMFDAQEYSYEKNIELTSRYVKEYGDRICIEGIMESLTVYNEHTSKRSDDYVEKAVEYVAKTGVDFLVADLGTEQQASEVGKSKYLKDRAIKLTQVLGKPMLVLHGTSCIDDDQIKSLASDGIARVNMWTRIAREAGQYAAQRLVARMDKIQKGNFDSTESMQYIFDNIDKASEIMEHILELLGYKNLAE